LEENFKFFAKLESNFDNFISYFNHIVICLLGKTSKTDFNYFEIIHLYSYIIKIKNILQYHNTSYDHTKKESLKFDKMMRKPFNKLLFKMFDIFDIFNFDNYMLECNNQLIFWLLKLNTRRTVKFTNSLFDSNNFNHSLTINIIIFKHITKSHDIARFMQGLHKIYEFPHLAIPIIKSFSHIKKSELINVFFQSIFFNNQFLISQRLFGEIILSNSLISHACVDHLVQHYYNIIESIKLDTHTFNFILDKCNIKSLHLAEELGIPLHIPLPRLTQQKSPEYTG
jgi:hypothetical protein